MGVKDEVDRFMGKKDDTGGKSEVWQSRFEINTSKLRPKPTSLKLVLSLRELLF
jgi:hypothetical protein